jgi:hypothetical protein
MTLDLDKYRIQLPYIKAWIETRPDYIFKNEVGAIALATSVPIIVVSHFIGELFGYTDEVLAKIQSDMAFYRITEVLGTKF